jgi:hypothetical protein
MSFLMWRMRVAYQLVRVLSVSLAIFATWQHDRIKAVPSRELRRSVR